MANGVISIGAAVSAIQSQAPELEPQRVDVKRLIATMPSIVGDPGEIASIRLAGDAAAAPRIGSMHKEDLTNALSALLLRRATFSGATFSNSEQAATWAAGMAREVAAWVQCPRVDYARQAVQRLTISEVDFAWREACSSLDPEWAGVRTRVQSLWTNALTEYATSPLAADISAIVRKMRQPAVPAIAQRHADPVRDARVTAAYESWASGKTRAESLRALAEAEPDRFSAADADAIDTITR